MLNLWISIGSADVSLHKKNLYLTFALDWILSSIDSFIPQALLKVEFFKSGVLFGWLYLKDPGFDWH